MDTNEIITTTGKSWYESKTMWFNILTAITLIATYFGYTPNQDFANHVSKFLVFASPFINMGLRKITKKEIK